MRLRTSTNGALFWTQGTPVWDDYVTQKQYQVSDDAIRVLAYFSDERDVDGLKEIAGGGDLLPLVGQMLSNGALMEVGSNRELEDRRTSDHWKPWGTAARYYHFASRTLQSAPYLPVEEDRQRLAQKATQETPPPLLRAVNGSAVSSLTSITNAPLAMSLDQALEYRRSARKFTGDALTLASLATLLHRTLGLVPRAGHVSHPDGSMFRTSPSGGARHPVEGFVYVANVAGLSPGYYHYNHVDHALNLCAASDVADIVEICGGQPWIKDAAAVVFYVGVTQRSMWKYNTLRAYRTLMMDVGHLSQTAFLVLTAMGLGATYTAALRDEIIEAIYGLEGVSDVVLGATVVGVPDPSDTAFLRGGE